LIIQELVLRLVDAFSQLYLLILDILALVNFQRVQELNNFLLDVHLFR